MNTATRTLAGFAVAGAVVTVALAAPANATPWGPQDMSGTGVPASGHGAHGHTAAASTGHGVNPRVTEYQRDHELGASPASAAAASAPITTDSGVDWDQVAYDAAAGIVLATAAGATVVTVRRHQRLPHHG